MDQKESKSEGVDVEEIKAEYLRGKEMAQLLDTVLSNTDRIAERFENMFSTELDGSDADRYMLGFIAGFRTARNINSDFETIALIDLDQPPNSL